MSKNYLVNFNFSSVTNSPSANSNPCPDQLVGELRNGTFSPKSRTNIDYLANKTINIKLQEPIVIILESPHKNEFDPITLQALGPAMGKTGENLKAYFESVIKMSKIYGNISSSSHDIVLVNAVQYQCSLGKKLNGTRSYRNKKQRDKNWLSCFNYDSNELTNRLNALDPYAVINLCTKGRMNLQSIVDKKINHFNNYTTGKHPSSWHYKNNRSIT